MFLICLTNIIQRVTNSQSSFLKPLNKSLKTSVCSNGFFIIIIISLHYVATRNTKVTYLVLTFFSTVRCMLTSKMVLGNSHLIVHYVHQGGFSKRCKIGISLQNFFFLILKVIINRFTSKKRGFIFNKKSFKLKIILVLAFSKLAIPP